MIFKNFYLNATAINTAAILIISYLIGSFPSAYIAGKIKGINISRAGDKNVGGMNTFQTVGKFAGVMVTIADVGKGALAAFIGKHFSDHIFVALLAVVFAVIGHNWMIYIGFKGGRGVSAFIGGLLYLSPLTILFLYFLLVPIALFILKDSYVATTFAFFFFSFFLWIYEGSKWWFIFGILITLVNFIKSFDLVKSYYTDNRKYVNSAVKKIFKPIFKGM
jgi:glycerol-3-phosphate acyltransferase PlsY